MNGGIVLKLNYIIEWEELHRNPNMTRMKFSNRPSQLANLTNREAPQVRTSFLMPITNGQDDHVQEIEH